MFKYRRVLFAILALLLLCVAGILLFSPRPILEDLDCVQSIRIRYNPYVNQDKDDIIEIYDYDSERILACLSQYKEQRTLSKAKGYWIGDVEMEIIVMSTDGLKQIILGNTNYTCGSYGTFKFKIIDPDELLLELKKYIDLPAPVHDGA